jgi:hypothetical protein
MLAALPTHAMEGTDGLDYALPEDLDVWLSDGALRLDEWEQLREWLDEPLNLDRATAADLQMLPGLGDGDVAAILSAAPLRPGGTGDVPAGLSPAAVHSLLSFTTFRARSDGGGHLRQVVSDAAGDGAAMRVRGFLRLRPSPSTEMGLGNVAGGLKSVAWDSRLRTVLAQDAARLARAYAVWSGGGPVRRAAAGDFSIGFGAGLILNTARRQFPAGLLPNDGATLRERGVGADLELGGVTGTAFAATVNRPATLPALARFPGGRAESALEDRLAGGHVEMPVGAVRVGATAYAQAYRSRAGVPLEAIAEGARTRWSLDASGDSGTTAWRVEMGRAGGWGVWGEIRTAGRRGRGLLALYSVSPRFDSPHGSRPADRSGAFGRVSARTVLRASVGGQVDVERRASTAVTTARIRLWISAPLARRMSGGAWLFRSDADVLRRGEVVRRSGGWLRWSGRSARTTVRVAERTSERSTREQRLTWRSDWSLGRRWSAGMGTELEAGPAGVRDMYLRQVDARLAIWPSAGPRAQVSVARRWYRGTAAEVAARNSLRLLVDYRWGGHL